MKKILITGGAGFIAHHIIAHIIKNTDWEIVTIDRLDISGNLNRLSEVLEQFSINEKKRLKIVFHDLKAEINSQITSPSQPNAINPLYGMISLYCNYSCGRKILLYCNRS